MVGVFRDGYIASMEENGNYGFYVKKCGGF